METITPNINLVSITCHNAFSTNINSVYNSMCPIYLYIKYKDFLLIRFSLYVVFSVHI